jgi:hypothetical protein
MTHPFTIRTGQAQDLDFIYKTWLSSYRYYSAIGRECRNFIFFENYKLVIDRILTNPETSVLVASPNDADTIILAYMITEPGVLHYTFTKGAFQRMGICRALFDHAFHAFTQPVTYTHKTNIQHILKTKDEQLIYNPFLLYNLKG